MELLSVNKEAFYKSNEKTLAYFLHAPSGSSSFPIVVASHGFGGTKEGANDLSKKLAEKLNEKRIGLLSYDFRGCGNSSGQIKNLEFNDFKEDLLDMLQLAFHFQKQAATPPPPVAIQATSFGGLVSSLSASEFYKDIAALAYVVPVAYGKTWLPIYQEMLKQLDDGQAVPFYNQVIKRSFAKVFLEARGDLSFEKYLSSMPSLVIYAENDETVPADHAHAYQKVAPQLQLIEIKGADHCFLQGDSQHRLITNLVNFYTQTLAI